MLWCSCHPTFITFLNQIRAKVGVDGIHVNCTVVVSRNQRDDVTRFQVENTNCVRGTAIALSRPRKLRHGHALTVDINIDPSCAAIVGVEVNTVRPVVGTVSFHYSTSFHPQDG